MARKDRGGRSEVTREAPERPGPPLVHDIGVGLDGDLEVVAPFVAETAVYEARPPAVQVPFDRVFLLPELPRLHVIIGAVTYFPAFCYIDLGGEGLTPVGYGYRSIEYILKNICKCIEASAGVEEKNALTRRQKLIKQFDEEGIMATPANSSYNELVTEAARLSILNGGREVEITYGDNAGVDLRI